MYAHNNHRGELPTGYPVTVYAHDVTSEWDRTPPDEQIEATCLALKMLSVPSRMKILWALSGAGELDVTTITEQVGQARPAVSQHLAKLQLAGLVAHRRDGRRLLYRVRGGHVRRLLIEALNAAEHQLKDLPEHD